MPLDSNGQWQTNYNSAGAYALTVTATDGLSTTAKTFNLNVNDIQQGGSGGGGGSSGGTNLEFRNRNSESAVITTPAIPAVPAVSTVEEAIPAVPESNVAEQNINAENQGNQITGFSVVDTIKQNPITTAVALVIVLGVLAYGIYWFRK